MATNDQKSTGKDTKPHNPARHPGETDDSVTQAVESGEPRLQGRPINPNGGAAGKPADEKNRQDKGGVAQQHLESGRHDATP